MSKKRWEINEDMSAGYVTHASGYDSYNQGFSYDVLPLAFNLQQKCEPRKLPKECTKMFTHYTGEKVRGISKYDKKEHAGKIVYITWKNRSEAEYAYIQDEANNHIIPLYPNTVKTVINKQDSLHYCMDYFDRYQNNIIRESAQCLTEGFFGTANNKSGHVITMSEDEIIKEQFIFQGYFSEQQCKFVDKIFDDGKFISLGNAQVDYYLEAIGANDTRPGMTPKQIRTVDKFLKQLSKYYSLYKNGSKFIRNYDNIRWSRTGFLVETNVILETWKDIQEFIIAFKKAVDAINTASRANLKFNISGIHEIFLYGCYKQK